LGYSIDHSNDTYKTLNLETKSISTSRNVVWLGNLETKSISTSRNVVWLGNSYNDWIHKKLPSNDQASYEDDEEFVERLRILNGEANDVEALMKIIKRKKI
jgi:hypothetical protein